MKDFFASTDGQWLSHTLWCAALAAVLLLAAWIYWPGINGPALLDDRSSVLVIGDLEEKPELALDAVFGDRSGLLGRSVSMTSFVLERMYLNEGIAGNKKVNILLHIFNGMLLIWLFNLLFTGLRVPHSRYLALVLGSIWILHPLFVSTVLYAVQRMAILSTLFMLLASLAYVYWRLALADGRGSVPRFLLIPALLLVALLAKENAIVLVPILLLLEVWWFECKRSNGQAVPWLRWMSWLSIGAGALGLLFILVFGYDDLAAKFHKRSFSLDERLLTQSRIVWDYVGQWLWPDVLRMGLYHDDFALSRSLHDPMTTIYAVAGWLLIVLLMLFALRWRGGRLLAIGIAWFLLGHSVESTVLPLELYFEHRNYFPTIGLLLFLGVALALVLRRWPQTAPPALMLLAFSVIPLAGMTSSQVSIWSSRPLLILNHLNGHPDSARANLDMAAQMASVGEAGRAHEYSARAFVASRNEAAISERQGDYEIRNLALSCIANQPVEPALIDNLGKADPGRPLSSVSTLLSMVRFLQDNRCPTFDRIHFADRLAEIYLPNQRQGKGKGAANIYSNLAVLENALLRYDNADAYADKFLALSPNNKRGLLMKLHFSTALGKQQAADEVIAVLQQMDQQGKLTVSEQQTLALYLER